MYKSLLCVNFVYLNLCRANLMDEHVRGHGALQLASDPGGKIAHGNCCHPASHIVFISPLENGFSFHFQLSLFTCSI